MVECLCIEGYRSLRDLRLAIAPLTVVTGANGSGKSSLYRALRLLADIAQGRVVGALAAEGGLSSVLWAGPETLSRGMKRGAVPVQGGPRRSPVALKLGFSSSTYGYAIDLGLPVGGATRFGRDPVIKAESLWTGPLLGRANTFAQRKGPVGSLRNPEGAWRMASDRLGAGDSMLTHCSDPRDAAELLTLRETLRDWRFYDHFRTDPEAPARRPQVGTRTPVLASDGADLAAALATIQDVGASEALDEAVADAFPGGSIEVSEQDGSFEVEMRQHGLLRPLRAAELSDGTLRYLLLVAALLSPRPPTLMILNEPETSLHPDLLPALSRLIARAATASQLIVVSHAAPLVAALETHGAHRIVLEKQLGETVVADAERPAWTWPTR
ncbi:MAG: AAA family ATPase [Proteobacteria bacterium]|nr:AAA family ATPase [Pseudomonadota bacterium]